METKKVIVVEGLGQKSTPKQVEEAAEKIKEAYKKAGVEIKL